MTYYRTVKMEHMTKKRVVAEQIHLEKEEYMEVSNMFLLFLIGAIFVYLFFICHVWCSTAIFRLLRYALIGATASWTHGR